MKKVYSFLMAFVMSATFASTAQILSPLEKPLQVSDAQSSETILEPMQLDQPLQLIVENTNRAPRKAPSAVSLVSEYEWTYTNMGQTDPLVGKITLSNYNESDHSVNVKIDPWGDNRVDWNAKGTYDEATGELSLAKQLVGKYGDYDVQFEHCYIPEGGGYLGSDEPLKITFTDDGAQMDANDIINLTVSGSPMTTASKNSLKKIVVPLDYSFSAWFDSYCSEDGYLPLKLKFGKDVVGVKIHNQNTYYTLNNNTAAQIMQIGVNLALNGPTTLTASYPLNYSGVNYVGFVAYNSNNEVIGMQQLMAVNPDRSEEGWVTKGTATFADNLLAAAFGTTDQITCEFQESTATPGRFRLVSPYANAKVKEGHNYHKHYLYINATDINDAYLEPSVLGYTHNSLGDFAAWSGVDYSAVIYNVGHANVSADKGTKVDNVITLPYNYLNMSKNEGGSFNLYTYDPLVVTLDYYKGPLPAEVLGYYKWTYSTGISTPESATGNVVISDYNAEDKSVSLTVNGYKLTATYDVATGKLTIPNNQKVGSVSGMDVYFYHGTGTPGNGFEASEEPLVGTVGDDAITFGENDYILFGKIGEGGGYTLYAYTNTWTKTEAPKTDYSLTAEVVEECPADGIFTLKLNVGSSIATFRTYFQKKYIEVTDDDAKQIAENGQQYNVTGELTLPFQTSGEGIYSVAIVGLDAEGNVVAKVCPYFVVNDTNEEGWTTVGTATFEDQIFAQTYKTVDTEGKPVEMTPETLTCELQESDETEGRYRLVNPYAESRVFPDVPHAGHNHYLFVNASDPNDAYIEPSIVGPQNYGQAVVWSRLDQMAMRFGLSHEYVVNHSTGGAKFGTMADDVITLPFTILGERDYLNGEFKLVGANPLVINLKYELELPDATFTDPDGNTLESASHKTKVIVTFNHDTEKVALYYRFEETTPAPAPQNAPMAANQTATDEDGNEYTLYSNPLPFEKSGTLYYFTQDARGHKSEIASMNVAVGASTTGIIEIEADTEALYFNMQGIQVKSPAPGDVVIRVCGGKATKVIIK